MATVRGVLGFAPVFLAARKDLGTGCRKLGKMEKDEEEVVVVGHTVGRVFYKKLDGIVPLKTDPPPTSSNFFLLFAINTRQGKPR